MSFSPKDISVIIPLYKGKKYCNRLLDLLDANILYENLYKKCKMEVIFINDYPDEKIDIHSGKYYEILLIEHEKNKGIHASRVDGVRQAKGSYVIMLDQDDLFRDNWLYSQWTSITVSNADYCVCNGWWDRFGIIWNDNRYEEKIKDVNYYIAKGNAIFYPGQVIIKKSAIPQEWLSNIQEYNGADDYLLWIMALKKGKKFIVNNECLFYHTPERTKDSIGNEGMLLSLKETLGILLAENFIDEIEKEKNLLRIAKLQNEMKVSVTSILQEWMKLKIHGVEVCDALIRGGIHKVAIYGLGILGQLLYEDLLLSDISVLYGIDKAANDFKEELTICKLEDDLKPVDAIIVATLHLDKASLKNLESKVECPIITLPDILVSMQEMLIEKTVI